MICRHQFVTVKPVTGPKTGSKMSWREVDGVLLVCAKGCGQTKVLWEDGKITMKNLGTSDIEADEDDAEK
jgi:hypothetical protein